MGCYRQLSRLPPEVSVPKATTFGLVFCVRRNPGLCRLPTLVAMVRFVMKGNVCRAIGTSVLALTPLVPVCLRAALQVVSGRTQRYWLSRRQSVVYSPAVDALV